MNLVVTGFHNVAIDVVVKIFNVAGLSVVKKPVDSALMSLSSDNRIVFVDVENKNTNQDALKTKLSFSGIPLICINGDKLISDAFKTLLQIGRFLGLGMTLTQYVYIVSQPVVPDIVSATVADVKERKKHPVVLVDPTCKKSWREAVVLLESSGVADASAKEEGTNES